MVLEAGAFFTICTDTTRLFIHHVVKGTYTRCISLIPLLASRWRFGNISSYQDLIILHSRSCYTIFQRISCISSASMCNEIYVCSGGHVKIYTGKGHIREALSFFFNITTLATKCRCLLVKPYAYSYSSEKREGNDFSHAKIEISI